MVSITAGKGVRLSAGNFGVGDGGREAGWGLTGGGGGGGGGANGPGNLPPPATTRNRQTDRDVGNENPRSPPAGSVQARPAAPDGPPERIAPSLSGRLCRASGRVHPWPGAPIERPVPPRPP